MILKKVKKFRRDNLNNKHIIEMWEKEIIE